MRHGTGRIDGDGMIWMDESCAKDNRRDMSLARGPQAHDEAFAAGINLSLVGVGDNRRIKQRSRSDGIFHREIRTQQESVCSTKMV